MCLKNYDRIQIEIKDWAKQTDNIVSQRMIYDAIRRDITDADNADSIDENVEKIIFLLEEQGIRVVDSDEEDYSSVGDPPAIAIPADVNIETKNVSLDYLIARLKNKEIDLNPDFQRNANLWSDIQKSRLIESLMLRIPIPSFYFDASDEDQWIVIDGLQRLSAIKGFVIDGSYFVNTK